MVVKQVRKTRIAIEHGPEQRHAILAGIQMRTRTRPKPIPRPINEPRPHRIEGDIAQRRRQMRLVHRHGAKPTLPKMTGRLLTRMNMSGILSMHFRERTPQTIGIGRVQDEMDMVGHEHPRPDFHSGFAAMDLQQVAVKRVIFVAEKCSRSAIATLRDMMGDARNDDAGKTSHERTLARGALAVNKVHCHRNPGRYIVSSSTGSSHMFSVKPLTVAE